MVGEVEPGDQAAGEQGRVEIGEEAVGSGQEVAGGRADGGVGVDGGTDLPHEGGSLRVVDICNATASVLSRHTGYDANVTRAILTACACADECSAHADMHEHCRLCAAACRSCEQACNDLIQALG
ncbi:four-helix bundle copper-binding protein [Streptomyces sp. NPDC018693]|uniref:four-helix bundle copper-binding protein n=1 Tax=unclassified Streptomyces TaxID=2593676 RepID=UPI0037B3DE31